MNDFLSNPVSWALMAAFVVITGWILVLYWRLRRVCQTPSESMAIIAQMFPDNVLIVDSSGRVVACSQPACEFFGYSARELEGLSVEALMPGEYASRHSQNRHKFMRGKPGKAMDNEIRCLGKQGEEIPAITRVRTFRLAGATYGLVAIQDLRTFKTREETLKALSERDPLTGVANRRLFDRDFHREWYRAVRNQSPVAVIMLDVDAFKEYNDYHGHPGGDACLQTIAGILSSIMRRSTDTLARYGGEEFVYLLPGIDEAEAARQAEELRQRVESANIPHGDSRASRWVTVSVGVAAMVPGQDDDMQDLISRADAALYRAKSGGRNRVRAWSELKECAALS